jgi:uncharacterized protein YkwD
LCLHVEELEPRLVLSGYQPTAAEEQFIELLNDARANPAGYGASIGLDLSYVAPAPPLAVNPLLVEAARLHSQDMNARAYFAHNTPEGVDPGARITATGYVWYTWGESIAAGEPFATPADALKALIIDAGVPDLGHRNHLLGIGSPDNLQLEVGVGIVQGGAGPYVNYYTIDTAMTPNSPSFLTGAVYNDANGNGKYDPGEGLGGVTITVAGVGSVTTLDAGGYSVALAPGNYTVTASGGPLTAPVTQAVTIGSSNVRLDFNPDPATAAQLQAFVALLYKDVLGRTPGTAEVNNWVAALESGMPRQAVVTGFLNSVEYDQNLVRSLYQQYLNRAADATGLANWVSALQHGASESAVRQAFLGSAEYWNNHGGTAAGFVQGLYNDLLGRSYTGQEGDAWIQLAAGGNLALVAGSILASPESDQRIISNEYQTYLRRSADPAGLSAFVALLQTGTARHFGIENFLDSTEYFTGAPNW